MRMPIYAVRVALHETTSSTFPSYDWMQTQQLAKNINRVSKLVARRGDATRQLSYFCFVSCVSGPTRQPEKHIIVRIISCWIPIAGVRRQLFVVTLPIFSLSLFHIIILQNLFSKTQILHYQYEANSMSCPPLCCGCRCTIRRCCLCPTLGCHPTWWNGHVQSCR